MTLKGTARAFYRFLQSLSDNAGARARTAWAQLDPKNLSGSWESNGVTDQLLVTVAQAQLAAATAAEPFVAAALAKQAAAAVPLGSLAPRSLAGIASDGRDLDSLLLQPLIQTLAAIEAGAPPDAALELGANAVDTIAQTQVSDAGRAGVDVAMTAHPEASGWVRMLVPPSCGRCVVLAGRVYRWSSGFDRHPQDDCVTVPAQENVADDLTTDPQAYFDSLTAAQQDRDFGKAVAAAIRDGADISQAVNARRGTRGMSRPGRRATTVEGTTRRGVAGARLRGAPRLMPQGIADIAGADRERRLELLQQHGYIL